MKKHYIPESIDLDFGNLRIFHKKKRAAREEDDRAFIIATSGMAVKGELLYRCINGTIGTSVSLEST